MSTAPQWQPRDGAGRWTPTGLAEEAAKAQVGVKALTDALRRLQAAQEAIRASEAAKSALGIKTVAQKKAALDAAKAQKAAAAEDAKATKAAEAAQRKAAAEEAKAAQRKAAEATKAAKAEETAKAKEAQRQATETAKAAKAAEAVKVKEARVASAEQSKFAKAVSMAQKRSQAEQTKNVKKLESDQNKAAKAASLAQRKASQDAQAAQAAQAASGKEAYNAMMHPVDALTGALSNMGPKGAAAAAAIKVAFVAATVAITATVGTMYALAKAAIEVTQARTQLLTTFGALSGGAVGGAKTLAVVERLGKQLPFATTKIAEWATELQKSGLQGRDLEGALKAVAAASALMGEQGGAAAQDLIKKLALGGFEAAALVNSLKRNLPQTRSTFAEMGLRIEDVAAAMGMTVKQMQSAKISAREMSEAIQRALVKKGAGPLGDLALQFPNMIAKVKEGFSSLFDKLGPAVKPFMKAVQSLFKEFYKGGSVIKTLKPIVTEVMTAFFKYATKAAVAAKSIAKAIGPTIAAIYKFFTAGAGLLMIKGVLAAIAVVAWVVAVAFLKLGFFVAAGIAIWSALAAAIGFVIDVIMDVNKAMTDWAGGALSAAGDFISGLVAGIKGGGGAVLDAVKGIANGAVAAFKGALGIASPSKVMAKMGGFAAEGVSVGLDQGASGVQASASKLGGATAGGVAGGMGKGGGKGMTVTFAEKSIVIDGAGKAGLEITEEMIAAVFERIAATQGLMGAT